jgi:hypothetical protein
MNDLVECHSEFEYAERPVALFWENQRLKIASIEMVWRVPGGKCFRVLVEDDRRFELVYWENHDSWQVNLV